MSLRRSMPWITGTLAVLLALPAALVVTHFVAGRLTPQQHIDAGRQRMQARDFPQAYRHFTAALKDIDNDASLWLDTGQALSRISVNDVQQAWQQYHELRRIWNRAVDLKPSDAQAVQSLMQLLYFRGHELEQPSAFDQMFQRADALVRELGDDAVLARRWRGIAQVNRMRTLKLSDVEHEQAHEDLLVAVKHDPDDVSAAKHLIDWYLIQAEVVDAREEMSAVAEPLRVHAYERSLELLQAQPLNPARQLVHIHVLTELGQYAMAQQALATLFEQAIRDPAIAKPALVAQIASMMFELDEVMTLGRAPGTSPTNLSSLALLLVDTAMKRDPQSVALLYWRAHALSALGRSEQAVFFTHTIAGTRVRGRCTHVLRAQHWYELAVDLRITTLLARAKSLEDGPLRQAAMRDADRVLDEVLARGETPRTLLLSGLLAAGEKRWMLAATRLDAASEQLQGRLRIKARCQAALAWNSAGRGVVAARRLAQLLRENRHDPVIRYELARVLMDRKQWADAERVLMPVLLMLPRSVPALSLHARIFAQTNRLDQAIVLYEQIGAAGDPSLAVELAHWYIRAGRQDHAVQMLEACLAQHPTNQPLLRELVQLAPSVEQAQHYLDSARESEIDPAVLDEIQQQIAALWQPTMERKLREALALVQADRHEEAQAAMVEALQLSQSFDEVTNVLTVMSSVWSPGRAHELAEPTQIEHQQWVELGLMRVDLAHGDAQAALDRAGQLDLSQMKDPGDMIMFDRLRAMALHHLRQYEQARALYEQVLQLSPDDAYVRNNLAYLLADALDEPADALPHALHAAALMPDSPAVLDTLGFIQFKLGQLDAAQDTLTRSYQRGPDASNSLHLAQLLLARGEQAQARPLLLQAIALAGQQDDPRLGQQAAQLLRQMDQAP